jgi:hypothetical protein
VNKGERAGLCGGGARTVIPVTAVFGWLREKQRYGLGGLDLPFLESRGTSPTWTPTWRVRSSWSDQSEGTRWTRMCGAGAPAW